MENTIEYQVYVYNRNKKKSEHLGTWYYEDEAIKFAKHIVAEEDEEIEIYALEFEHIYNEEVNEYEDCLIDNKRIF